MRPNKRVVLEMGVRRAEHRSDQTPERVEERRAATEEAGCGFILGYDSFKINVRVPRKFLSLLTIGGSHLDWSTQTILITGGTGSFGKAFVGYLQAHHPPKRLVIFSRDEFKQFEMSKMHNERNMRYFLGDVRDLDRLKRACVGVDCIVHAAALKQVPACEYNPFEAVKTNIQGAQNVIDAAIECGVRKTVALSTDKAVSPANLYGATKLCAEKVFTAGNAYVSGGARTHFSIVRYGNVMGSRGSVVPVFLAHRKTGVLPITDVKMTRFWIALHQGVRMVVNSIEKMKGGEIFIPKIPSLKVVDLARAIAPECKHEVIGIRSGEKLHELLISEEEMGHTREFDDSFLIEPNFEWFKARWSSGKPVVGKHAYSSETNDNWLSVEQLGSMLEQEEVL